MSIYAKENQDGTKDLGNAGVLNGVDARINPATEETLQSIAGLNIPKHDTRELGYADGNLTTVTYKLGGVTVATKTLTYIDGAFNLNASGTTGKKLKDGFTVADSQALL